MGEGLKMSPKDINLDKKEGLYFFATRLFNK